MATIVQITTLAGKIVEKARWKLDKVHDMREDQTIQLNAVCHERMLIAYVANKKPSECYVDLQNKSEPQVIMGFKISSVRHMLDAQSGEMDTLISAIPVNRIVEGMMMFIFQRKDCDPKFISMLKSAVSDAD